jgi:hypothetical protein
MTDDDGYDGPAELVADGAVVAVQVKLAGQFEPVRGSYHWYGRVAASAEVAALAGHRVELRTPHGSVETLLADVDPWGRPRVEGFGTAPFPVVTTLP